MVLTITLIQSKLDWEDIEANLDRFTDLINQTDRSDLMILPEMFSTGFSMRSEQLAEGMDGRTVSWMREQANRTDTTICGSVIIHEHNKFVNRFIWARPNGTIQHYDKKHLFRMSEENENYSPGQKRLIVKLKDFNICPQICYDLRFPVFSRNVAQGPGEPDPPYDLLLYVANWPSARRLHWRALLQARAIENQCYVVGVNRIGVDGNKTVYQGDSCVLDPQGSYLADLADDATSVTVSLDMPLLKAYRENFPAWKDSDRFDLK